MMAVEYYQPLTSRRMDKHPRGLLTRASSPTRKKMERDIRRVLAEVTSADFKLFLAHRGVEKTINRILFGESYRGPVNVKR
jgi:hypothetical protein